MLVGWGGHQFVLGGAVDGAKILGEYPASLDDASELSLGRGRILPTTPWEGLWNGIAEWMGVDSDQIDTLLPNKKNFASSRIFTQSQLFK